MSTANLASHRLWPPQPIPFQRHPRVHTLLLGAIYFLPVCAILSPTFTVIRLIAEGASTGMPITILGGCTAVALSAWALGSSLARLAARKLLQVAAALIVLGAIVSADDLKRIAANTAGIIALHAAALSALVAVPCVLGAVYGLRRTQPSRWAAALLISVGLTAGIGLTVNSGELIELRLSDLLLIGPLWPILHVSCALWAQAPSRRTRLSA